MGFGWVYFMNLLYHLYALLDKWVFVLRAFIFIPRVTREVTSCLVRNILLVSNLPCWRERVRVGQTSWPNPMTPLGPNPKPYPYPLTHPLNSTTTKWTTAQLQCIISSQTGYVNRSDESVTGCFEFHNNHYFSV